MSRVSLWNRIERLRKHLLPPGSIQWRIERLNEADREAFKSWQRAHADIISRAETEPGAAYEAMCEGRLNLPKLPQGLRYKVWPYLREVDELAKTDPAAAYQRMLQGDQE